MNFLYPSFLWALLVLAIPIIVHLFNFRRPKKVLFTNVRFLKQVKQATQSNLKIKHWLILAARLLTFAFLVFAFAQPYLPQNNAQNAAEKRYVAVYVDNSFSMQVNATNTEGNSLDESMQLVSQLVNAYPIGTSFSLMTNSVEPTAQTFYGADKFLEKIAEITFSNSYRSANAILARQHNDLATVNARQGAELFWLSDFQKSTWNDLETALQDSTHRINLVPIQSKSVANLFIDSVWLETPFVTANENNILHAQVYNFGNKDASNLLLKLFIDDVQVSTASVSVEANQSAVADFTFTVTDNSAKKCKITVQDFPVTFDNDYYFVLQTAPPIQIMHLYSGKPTPFIQNVYANENLFALKSYDVRNVDYEFFKKADLVILENIENINESLVKALQELTENGKSVAIFPAVSGQEASYNLLTTRLGLPNLQKMNLTARDSSSIYKLAAPDIKNPFFAGVFEKMPQNVELPYAKPSFAWSGGNKIINYKEGSAFLSQFRTNKGKTYLFAASTEPEVGNFGRHSLFLAVMYRIAITSFGGAEALAFSFQDENITLNIAEKKTEQVFELFKDDVKIIPIQRVVGNKLILQLPKTNLEPGYYTLSLNGNAEKMIALNYGSAESKLAYYSPEELQTLAQNKPHVRLLPEITPQNFSDAIKSADFAISLWKYCLLLALLFLLAEVLLVRFWK